MLKTNKQPFLILIKFGYPRRERVAHLPTFYTNAVMCMCEQNQMELRVE